MTSAQISFTIPDKALKEKAYQKAKSEGVTMKALFISFLNQYTQDKYKMELVSQQNEKWDDTIETAENKKHYKEAMEDYKNGINFYNWDELKDRHNFTK